MKRLANIGDKTAPWIFGAGLILVWCLLLKTGVADNRFLPYPHEVVAAFFRILSGSIEDIAVTLKEALIGLAASIVIATVMALVMDTVAWLRKAIYPLLVISQAIPIISLAPMFILWFGFGILPKIVVVVLVCFFPIVVNLLEGLNSVDPDMINLLRSMGAGRFMIFKLLKFPAVLTSFFSGLRISTTYSVMGAVIGEWLGGEAGLGMRLLYFKRSYAVDKLFAMTFIIVLLSMILFKLVVIIQDVAMPWQRLMNKDQRR